MTISALLPGQRFLLADYPYSPAIRGTLISASESRAVVRLDRPPQVCDFEDSDGNHRHFTVTAGRLTTWSGSTPVEIERNL